MLVVSSKPFSQISHSRSSLSRHGLQQLATEVLETITTTNPTAMLVLSDALLEEPLSSTRYDQRGLVRLGNSLAPESLERDAPPNSYLPLRP